MPPGTPDDIQPPSQPLPSHLGSAPGRRSPLGWASDPLGDVREHMAERRHIMRSALIAGLIGGLASLSGLPALMLIVAVASGSIAVSIFHRRMPGAEIPAGKGFRIGLLTGLFVWLAAAVPNALAMLSQTGRTLFQQKINSEVTESIHRSIATAHDPVAAEAMKNMLAYILTPEGMAVFFFVSMLFAAFASVLLGGIGGTIGAKLFVNRTNRD
jgi:hypothetical protein